MARRVDHASNDAAPAPANDSAYHILRCRGISYGRPRNAFPGAIGLAAAGVAAGSIAAGAGATLAAISLSVATLASGAAGKVDEREESSDEISETAAVECVSAFTVFALCGAENTNKIAANSMNHLSRLRALQTRSPLATF